jgi:hypothetical protein
VPLPLSLPTFVSDADASAPIAGASAPAANASASASASGPSLPVSAAAYLSQLRACVLDAPPLAADAGDAVRSATHAVQTLMALLSSHGIQVRAQRIGGDKRLHCIGPTRAQRTGAM